MEKGYLYIATGETYIAEATVSVNSLRRHAPHIHATLITDEPVTNEAFDQIQVLPKTQVYQRKRKEGFMYKVMGLQHSPYEKTFFVDTDTWFCDHCEELFLLLNYYDLLVAPAPADVTPVVIDGQPLEGYITYNTGIIVFKKSPLMTQFLADWLRLFEEKYHHCQPPFVDALLHHKVHLYALQPIYNFRVPFFVALPPKKIKIIHGRSDDYEQLVNKVNHNPIHRGWDPVAQRMLRKKVTWKERVLEDWKFLRKSVWNWLHNKESPYPIKKSNPRK